MRTLGEIYVPSVENFVLSDGILFSSDETFFFVRWNFGCIRTHYEGPTEFLGQRGVGVLPDVLLHRHSAGLALLNLLFPQYTKTIAQYLDATMILLLIPRASGRTHLLVGVLSFKGLTNFISWRMRLWRFSM